MKKLVLTILVVMATVASQSQHTNEPIRGSMIDTSARSIGLSKSDNHAGLVRFIQTGGETQQHDALPPRNYTPEPEKTPLEERAEGEAPVVIHKHYYALPPPQRPDPIQVLGAVAMIAHAIDGDDCHDRRPVFIGPPPIIMSGGCDTRDPRGHVYRHGYTVRDSGCSSRSGGSFRESVRVSRDSRGRVRTSYSRSQSNRW